MFDAKFPTYPLFPEESVFFHSEKGHAAVRVLDVDGVSGLVDKVGALMPPHAVPGVGN